MKLKKFLKLLYAKQGTDFLTVCLHVRPKGSSDWCGTIYNNNRCHCEAYGLQAIEYLEKENPDWLECRVVNVTAIQYAANIENEPPYGMLEIYAVYKAKKKKWFAKGYD